MEINTNSWHYLVIKHISRPNAMPTSLCPYVRALIFRLGLIAFVGILVLMLISLIGIGTFSTLSEFTGTMFDFINTQDPFANVWYVWPLLLLVGTVTTTGIIAACFGVVAGFIGAKTLVEMRSPSFEESDNVLIKYAVAKHNKICPRIVYKD